MDNDKNDLMHAVDDIMKLMIMATMSTSFKEPDSDDDDNYPLTKNKEHTNIPLHDADFKVREPNRRQMLTTNSTVPAVMILREKSQNLILTWHQDQTVAER